MRKLKILKKLMRTTDNELYAEHLVAKLARSERLAQKRNYKRRKWALLRIKAFAGALISRARWRKAA